MPTKRADGAPPRAALPASFRKSVTDVRRAAMRIGKLSEDDRMTRNRSLLAQLYLPEVRMAHAQLTQFLAFLEKASRGE